MKILHPNLPPLLLLISFIFCRTIFVTAVDKFFETCRVPKYCGNQTISFPFYIQDVQEQFCGHPGFQISCDYTNGKPSINFFGQDYIIHNIFYENKSIIVSNLAFDSSQNPRCFPSAKNLSLPGDRFAIASNESQVFLLYDCQSSHLSPSTLDLRVGCYAENDTNYVLALPPGKADLVSTVSRECGAESELVAAPVMNWTYSLHGGFSTNNYNNNVVEALRGGFLLNWTASDCALCNRTGGKCGFNYVTRHFMCYCPDRPHTAQCNPPGNSATFAAKIGGAIASIVVVGVLIIIFFCLKKKSAVFCLKNQDKTHQTIETFLRNYGPVQVSRYSYHDIKKITKSFKEKLGKGGFGDVYKGKLDDGSLVAVKVLNQSKSHNGQEFINEVATISRASHVNIVTLLGFCFEGNKRALIYEFMPNGSLEKFVFEEENVQVDNSTTYRLNWENRYQISLGIAKGLKYLHRGCNARIVHFDIKPHNILLDADFVPKISDFGLAKICTKDISCVSMLEPRGTQGYAAPEVGNRNFGEVSHKSDVYSYGMMILEMVGGRRNINVAVVNTSEIYFPTWIYRRLELGEDFGLNEIVNKDERSKVRKMVMVSLWCIQTYPSVRLGMDKVIKMLEGDPESLVIPPNPFKTSSPSRSSDLIM